MLCFNIPLLSKQLIPFYHPKSLSHRITLNKKAPLELTSMILSKSHWIKIQANFLLYCGIVISCGESLKYITNLNKKGKVTPKVILFPVKCHFRQFMINKERAFKVIWRDYLTKRLVFLSYSSSMTTNENADQKTLLLLILQI